MTRCCTFLERRGWATIAPVSWSQKNVDIVNIIESRDAPFPTCNGIVSIY